MMLKIILSQYWKTPVLQKRFIKYIQGQEPEPKIREYFYFIDHQGMVSYCIRLLKTNILFGSAIYCGTCIHGISVGNFLYNTVIGFQLFLDDAKMKNFTSCFKEKKFLEFFFKRIRLNNTGRYQKEFPFISLCGRERNYIRCDDVPIVYTHMISNSEIDFLTYGYAGELLKTEFIPEKIYMLPSTGRVYHPADDKYGGIGLVRSKLAIELSKNFLFKNSDTEPPTHFIWKDRHYELENNWFKQKIDKFKIQVKSDSD